MNALASISPINARLPQTYFVQDRSGRVKIGYATCVYSRLKGLQTGNSDELRLIRIVDGGERTERWLHRRFADVRIRGEWFEYTPEMLTVCPPDEVPVRQVIKPSLPLTLRERILQHERFGMLEGRLLCGALMVEFTDDEAAACLAWMREYAGVPPTSPNLKEDA